MRFSFAALVVFVASAVSAYDFREPIALPAGQTEVSFAVELGNTCATWAPAIQQGLTFEAFNLEAGDYTGAHNETQALVSCVWNEGGNDADPVDFTLDVIKYLNATSVSGF
uniref:Uncharacterized protein n=1 Tax=Mycena chlorophos TaxID=658473 RepID=A0ABQ0LR43_MYCCL|nr:predicted protein [Mycena chlorophos]